VRKVRWPGNYGVPVEIGRLVLSHSINFLPVIALKAQLHHIVAADNRLVFPPADFETPAFTACGLVIVPVIFLEDFLSVAVEGHNACRIHFDAETSVLDGGVVCSGAFVLVYCDGDIGGSIGYRLL